MAGSGTVLTPLVFGMTIVGIAQVIRSLGSTVGTAVIGSIVTKGYAEGLGASALP